MLTSIIARLRKLWNIIVRTEETQAVLQWMWQGAKFLWGWNIQIGLALLMSAATVVGAWMHQAPWWQIWAFGLGVLAAALIIIRSAAWLYEVVSRKLRRPAIQETESRSSSIIEDAYAMVDNIEQQCRKGEITERITDV